MTMRAEKIGIDPEKLRQLLNQQIQNQESHQTEATEAAGKETGESTSDTNQQIKFDLIPEELEAYLDKYVIGQPEAKSVLSTKICTHFNRLKLLEKNQRGLGNIKNNVLLIGPTGVGKTYLIKLIANKIGVPFVKGDATKFSETGYVGGDVEDLVRELVREADGNIAHAEHGIIYIDEIDKIASSSGMQGPDVSRSGVQRNLLKLMEETEVDLKTPHDIASQMEAVMQMQQGGKVERKKINTGNILFIVSGAFAGLEEIIGKRLNRNSIGFNSNENSQKEKLKEIYSETCTEDLIEYGFESEFIGRLPVIAVLHELSERDLLSILRNPNSSVIISKKTDFRAYDIDIEFCDEALKMLAANAYKEKIGARSLVGAVERALLPFERKLPSTAISHFVVNSNVVKNPHEALNELLRSSPLAAYIQSFLQISGIELSFTNEAEKALLDLANKRNIETTALCDELFYDYNHGLKLVGLTKYEISEKDIDAPAEALNGLIKKHYENQHEKSD